MPLSAPHRCARCKALVRGRCPCTTWADTPASWTRNSTGDPRWRKVRAARLNLDPLCPCGSTATTADHLDGTDYTDDSGRGASWLNIYMTRSLCTPCHARRTAMQGVAARNLNPGGV